MVIDAGQFDRFRVISSKTLFDHSIERSKSGRERGHFVSRSATGKKTQRSTQRIIETILNLNLKSF